MAKSSVGKFRSSVLWLACLLAPVTSVFSGCSVLVGNVRPVEEQSVGKLTQTALGPPWIEVSLANTKAQPSLEASDLPDLSYQNQQTGSTLAFTSGCRKTYSSQPPSLRAVAQSLGGGLTKIQTRRQIDTDTRGSPSLLTTLEGTASGEEIVIHNVILQNKGCLLDLTLVSLKRHFDADRPAFDTVWSTIPLPH